MFFETLDLNFETQDRFDFSQIIPCTDFTFVSADDDVRFAATACSEVLRSANKLLGRAYYRWHHVVGLGALPDRLVETSSHAVVLVGGSDTPWIPIPDEETTIRKHLRMADRLCIVGSGVFVPMICGIRHSQPVAVHPNFRLAISEMTWQPEISHTTTCHSRTLSSATSGIAGIRMMVELVSQQNGAFTGKALANYLGLNATEASSYSKDHWRYLQKAQGNPSICAALSLMTDHLEDTLSVRQIAELMDISPRQLERCFSNFLDLSPNKVYRFLRLERVRTLLVQTSLSISEIAAASGFSSASSLSKWYKHRYEETVQETRKRTYCGGITI